jgi:hypothetical protein
VAEGARLESVFTRKGNVGSNPTLSASKSSLQRNSAAFFPEICERCRFFAILPQPTGLRRKDRSAAIAAFSWLFSGGRKRSPVSRRALGECNAITSLRLGHDELTFASTLESRSAANDMVR